MFRRTICKLFWFRKAAGHAKDERKRFPVESELLFGRNSRGIYPVQMTVATRKNGSCGK